MISIRCCAATLLVLGWLVPALAAADVKTAEELPPHALVRLGTQRLRHRCAPGASLAFSPDGKTLASAGVDGVIRLWDAATGTEIRSLEGHVGSVHSVYFREGGKQLLSAGADNTVRRWDALTGKELKSFAATKATINALLLSADKTKVLRVCASGAVHQLDLGADARERRVLQLDPVGTAWAVSPDGKSFATADGNPPRITVYDVQTGKIRYTQPVRIQGVVNGLTFSPDGKVLGVSGLFPGVGFLEVETGKNAASPPSLPSGAVSRLTFSADNRLVTGVNDNAFVRVWGTASGQVLRQLYLTRGTQQALAVSPDGSRVAVGDNQAIRVWDIAADRELGGAPGHSDTITAARFTKDGTQVVTIGSDFRVCEWDARSGRRTLAVDIPSPSAREVVLCPEARTVLFMDTQGTFALAVGEVGNGRRVIDNNPTRLTELMGATSDGNLLLFRGPGGRIGEGAVVDRRTGKGNTIPTMEPKGFNAGARALSPDGRTVTAFVSDTTPLRFWDVRKTVDLPVPKYSDGPGFVLKDTPLFLTYSPDGTTLLAGTPKPALWEICSGQPRVRMPIPADDILTQASVSADGSLVALGTTRGVIHVFATVTGEELGKLAGHRDRVTSLEFAPDGVRLLSGGADTTAVIWDVKEWRERARAKRAETRPADLPGLWSELADADAGRAYRALLVLTESAPLAVPFLKARLLERSAGSERIERLIRDLDSDDFETREKATTELDVLGSNAVPALHRALETTTSEEVRRRAEKLIKKHQTGPVDMNGVRLFRCLEILENTATPDAVAVLEELAKLNPKLRLAEGAKASLARLTKRSSKP